MAGVWTRGKYSGVRKYLDIDVWTAARQRMAQAYEMFDRIVVAFSAGKDSMAALELTIDVARELDRLPVDVLFVDEECQLPQCVQYAERTAARPEVNMLWACVPIKHRNACSREHPFWYPWDPAAEDRWLVPKPDVPNRIDAPAWWPNPGLSDFHLHVPALLGETRSVGLVMGIRAQESLSRYRLLVRLNQAETWYTLYESSTVAKVMPIYDMRTDDIWALAATHGWDYNTVYDFQERIGLPRHSQRVSQPFGEQPMQRMWQWQLLSPETYERMLDRVPGARTAARYSTTELYSFVDRDRIPGLTWQETIARYLSRYEPRMRRHTASRVRREVVAHYSRTREPLPEDEPHDITGACWRDLALLASRSDTKERFDSVRAAKLLTCDNFREYRHRMTDEYFESWCERCEGRS